MRGYLVAVFVAGLVITGCVSTRSTVGRENATQKQTTMPAVAAYAQASERAQQDADDVEKAASAYDKFLARYPWHPLAAQALLNKGVLYHNQADALFAKGVLDRKARCVRKAVKAYNIFLARFPHDPQASNVLMKKGVLCANAGDRQRAIKAYATFLARFPDDSQAGNVRAKRDSLVQETGGTAP